MAAKPQAWNSDWELVQAACSGNRDAFNEIYCRFGPDVWKIARKWAAAAGQQNDADDLYQELWVHILSALPKWKPDGELLHFISHVASRRAISWWRRNRNPKWLVPLDDSDNPIPLSTAAQISESQIAVEECLESFDPRHKRILRLLRLGHTAKEVSEILGVAQPLANVWIFRARKKLQDCLRHKPETPTRIA